MAVHKPMGDVMVATSFIQSIYILHRGIVVLATVTTVEDTEVMSLLTFPYIWEVYNDMKLSLHSIITHITHVEFKG